MELLDRLNQLREEGGKVPLRKWTGTEAQLRKAIVDRIRYQTPQEDEETLIAKYLAEGGQVKYGRGANAKGVRRQGARRRGGKIQDKPKLTAVTDRVMTRAVHIPDDCFHISELRDAPAARLRGRARQVPELAKLNVRELGRWVFRRKDRDLVIRLMWPGK